MRPTTLAGAALSALLLLLPAACSPKAGAPPLSDAGPSASVAVPPEPAAPSAQPAQPSLQPSAPDEPDEPPPARSGESPRRLLSTSEPRRATLSRLEDEPLLRPHAELVRAHFGGTAPSPLALQSAALGGEQRALLVMGGAEDRRPFILVVDAEGRQRWTKERPLAGIAPGVSEIVLLPGPDGQVVITWFDAPTKLVALRAWDATGGILADYRLFAIESGEALSGLYWPGQGFLVVAAQAHGAARAQLLDERGRLVWGDVGRALPWTSRTGAPVALALDTDRSVMLFQAGDAVRPAPVAGPARALATRLDVTGAASWERPVDLGVAVPVEPVEGGGGEARIVATRAAEGIVRVAIPLGARRRAFEINTVGVVSAARAR